MLYDDPTLSGATRVTLSADPTDFMRVEVLFGRSVTNASFNCGVCLIPHPVLGRTYLALYTEGRGATGENDLAYRLSLGEQNGQYTILSMDGAPIAQVIGYK